MLEKGFAATTSTDAHGDKLSKKQLIQMANEINEDKYARGAGLAHDLLAMPIGKTIHGEVIPIGANEYGLEIQQELFDKLSDSISEDIEKSYQVIKKAIASFVKLANHNERPITYVFEDNYNDILVQLIVRSNNADKVLMSIEKEKICIIAHKIDELKTQFPINKVQFLYCEENEQWEFRYLTTATGAVIGTKIAFRYTKELISQQPFAQRLDIKLVPQNNNEQ